MANSKNCPNCGRTFTQRRGDQSFCSADCNREYRARKRQIAAQRPGPKRDCMWCGDPFEAKRQNHDCCSEDCRNRFNNWAKGHAVKLIKILFAWRYLGRRKNITDVCQAVRDTRDDFKKKRGQPRAALGMAAQNAPGPGARGDQKGKM